MSVTLGHIVISRAGRDAGKKFIVVKIVDDLYVMVADGDLRRLEKPKKKKRKHLEFTGRSAEEISNKLANNAKVTNADIRKALASYEGIQPDEKEEP